MRSLCNGCSRVSGEILGLGMGLMASKDSSRDFSKVIHTTSDDSAPTAAFQIEGVSVGPSVGGLTSAITLSGLAFSVLKTPSPGSEGVGVEE